ncbi:MAG: phage head closure protein [Ruminococcus flavefaciens]|nr:phage head closure protein [Ruminococcus flavefaciens]
MDISKLRSRITIQHSEVVKDAIGNHINTWTDFYSCAAYANLASGKEYGAAGQNLGTDTLVFEVRWCERLRDLDSTKFRILFGGAVYNITCVDDVQFRHERLKLTAQREGR